jgi:hypothetical protein
LSARGHRPRAPPPHHQYRSPELPANWPASEQPLPRWCTENGLDGRSLRQWTDRPPQPAAICRVELARSARTTPEHLRLTLDGVVIDVPDGFNAQRLTRSLAVGTC